MSQTETAHAAPDESAPAQLEGGTYEIIRNRLNGYGKDLRQRLDQLNEARKEVFGAIGTSLLSTERITTDHNCVPRDMVSVGNRFLFGFNVHFGLKTETDLSDVFAVYEFRDNSFHPLPLEIFHNQQFERDFKEIYRYYKNAQFAKFFRHGNRLYMVFRIGKNVADIKALKWFIQGDSLKYLDNRSDHEVRYPPQHDFEWIRTTRDQHRAGEHPHISIEDRVFVETVGGDLTVKIENNTASGGGIYAEDVDNKDQTLDDAEIYYAILGNTILMKIRPYQEEKFRYIVYNEKIEQARRIDAIEDACVLLPDDHGLIFSNGYYLQNGEHKTFENHLENMVFERRIVAPNGEDYLYVFYNRDSGTKILLPYNLIEQRVDTPMICHGATFFEGGEMVCFKSHDDPQKHHAIQLWQTPHVGEEFVPQANTDSYLYKVGNRDLVRGMAECHEVLNLIQKEDTYANLYIDLLRKASDIVDSYFWIDSPDTFQLKKPLLQIKEAAAAAIEEFEKVVRVKQNTASQTQAVKDRASEILATSHHRRFDRIDDFVNSLGDLRAIRGDIISLRDLRYVDESLIESLEKNVAEQAERLSQRCVQFLLDPEALEPYLQRVEQESDRIPQLTKVADAKKLAEDIGASAAELEMLIDIVSNLKIDDATHRTTIIDNISLIFSRVNQARAALKSRTRELMSVEGVAEFNSQMKLLNQGVVNYLDICDTPDKCEEFLTKVMIQIEELEGRFAEFDEFVLQLTEKREEIYNAFETRKISLVEARNKRASSLMSAAERILKGIKSRVESLDSINDINGYFAADLMIEKVRDIVKQLTVLDDSVKVDDIQSRMKTIKEDAVRQLKDRKELFVDGQNIIKFGSHRFSVNVQALDLTTVLRDGQMNLHLTGTNFFEPIGDAQLLDTRDVWDQEVVSENADVYRGEYLAYCLLQELESSADPSLADLARYELSELDAFVQRFMGPRYSEAYIKGVHDHDAARMLQSLLEMKFSIGLLRYPTQARALARLFWQRFGDAARKQLMAARLGGFGAITRLFPDTSAQKAYAADLREMLQDFVERTRLFSGDLLDAAAEYLVCELARGGGEMAISRTAAQWFDAFHGHLRSNSYEQKFAKSLADVADDPVSGLMLARDWVEAFLETRRDVDSDTLPYIDEASVLLLEGKVDAAHVVDGQVHRNIPEMRGVHKVIVDGQYHLNYNQFLLKLASYQCAVVPKFRQYLQRKKDLVDQSREEMRLDEFRPRVLTSFVRNRLIDQVYLPLIGDNLAKQMGVVGEQKRTDLMGLLLLVSPPGYGKTTLMEYLANRLGIIFMKINGPAIGHHVTSLDPDEAPNAGAREEVEKLNLSLEMGDNVMIYLDDIQHCNPEFLQKFISLCDAQRKIEGVYKGRTRTYDLRGRKVVVVMAGNPYTESGDKFQIPDMLSNRADVYNLGEIIGESKDAFEMSYLENALTSNPVLNKLSSRSQKDVYSIIQIAEHDDREGVSLEGNYSLEELNEMVAVMKKLMRVRDVVLTVNREYIRSAAQSDDYRTEPPFKLQGSYRNMNRIAEKVVPIMNEEELNALLLSNYENDAQTLTSDNEANMLKFKELMGIISEEEAQRWASIKRTFSQNVKMRGVDAGDQVGQVVLQLREFSDGLDAIRRAMTEGVAQLAGPQAASENTHAQVAKLIGEVGGLREGVSAISEALAQGIAGDALKQLAAQLKEALPATQRAAAAPNMAEQLDQKITVQHKVPRSILNVLKSQFELMHNWMVPIFKATEARNEDVLKLQHSMNLLLDNYSALLKELEVAGVRKIKGQADPHVIDGE